MNDKQIDRVGEQVGRQNLADHILAWDRKQQPTLTMSEVDGVTGETRYLTVDNPDARRCGANKAHGLLQMHANGHSLVCPVSRPAPCPYSEPVSR